MLRIFSEATLPVSGFDVFDSLLFNYVAPLVLADLLAVDSETKEGQESVTFWFVLSHSLEVIAKWALTS